MMWFYGFHLLSVTYAIGSVLKCIISWNPRIGSILYWRDVEMKYLLLACPWFKSV